MHPGNGMRHDFLSGKRGTVILTGGTPVLQPAITLRIGVVEAVGLATRGETKRTRMGFQEQWHPKRDERMASHPSRKMRGVKASAASGSAHGLCHTAFTTNPARAIHAM